MQNKNTNKHKMKMPATNQFSPQIFFKILGDIIHSLRREKRITQKVLSERTQISISYLSEIENGKSNPGLDVYIKISEALDTEFYLLLFEATEKAKVSPVQKNKLDVYKRVFKDLDHILKDLNEGGGDDNNDRPITALNDSLLAVI